MTSDELLEFWVQNEIIAARGIPRDMFYGNIFVGAHTSKNPMTVERVRTAIERHIVDRTLKRMKS